MNVFILRHAIAVERGTKGYADDSKRPLTAEGEKEIFIKTVEMQRRGLKFDLIFSSPYVRAKQTATIVAVTHHIKSSRIIYTKNLLPNANFRDLCKEINAHSKLKNFLLVGHEPHLSQLISYLLTGNNTLALELKKGGLCHLNFKTLVKPAAATLRLLY